MLRRQMIEITRWKKGNNIPHTPPPEAITWVNGKHYTMFIMLLQYWQSIEIAQLEWLVG
jgi:hypothetical protein